MFTLASTLSTFLPFLSNNQKSPKTLSLSLSLSLSLKVSSFNAFLIFTDMKLTSNLLQVSNPNSTEELSRFYNLFQETLQEMKEMKNTTSPTNSNKRRRKSAETTEEEEDSSKKNSLKNIFTSLLLLEEEETADQQESNKSAEEEKSLLDTNHNKKTQVMLDYYSQFQNYCSDVEESEKLRIKRSRLSTTSGLFSVASKISSENTTSPNSTVTTTQPQGGQQQHRRLWVKDRSKAWWDKCNHPDFPDSDFRQAFRMSRATFDMICDELNSVVAKEDTMLRQAIPVQQRVAVCIWRLATGEPLRLVSKRFGLGISTCHKLVLEVCSAIRTVLMPKFLNWPDEEGVEKIKKDYESISGIPNVVGSMYTTHIPIIAPKVSVAAYFNKRHTERNQKTSYSITVQGVVNPNGAFTDVCIGWPGSYPDDQVLEKSALCTRANGGLMKGVWIVGSSGYPLMDWVLVPYTKQDLTWTEHAFNEKIGEVQRVAKDAFARLKGRWGCLQKRTEVKLQDLPVVLGACCVLHNICEMRNEEIDPELRFDLVDDEMVPEINIRSESSRIARDSIAHNLLHHQHAGTSFM